MGWCHTVKSEAAWHVLRVSVFRRSRLSIDERVDKFKAAGPPPSGHLGQHGRMFLIIPLIIRLFIPLRGRHARRDEHRRDILFARRSGRHVRWTRIADELVDPSVQHRQTFYEIGFAWGAVRPQTGVSGIVVDCVRVDGVDGAPGGFGEGTGCAAVRRGHRVACA